MAQSTPWVPLSSARREVRLLDLAPRSHERDELSCDLRVVSLDDEPAYEALSYVWGEKASPPHVLYVGDQEMTITQNLFDALQSLRRDDQIRTLWVDAVCIMQINNEERSWQVSLMGDIYKNSQMVLIWLGFGDVDLIKDVVLHAPDMQKHFTESPMKLLQLIEMNPWWRRAWTLQEAVLGPALTFCSGKECCSDGEFIQYFWCLDRHFILRDACCEPLLGVDGFRALVDIRAQTMNMFESRTTYMFEEKPKDLLRLTLDHQDRKATDPRDKIFAFVGMADSDSVPANLVQYGLPVRQTMINTASKLLQGSNTLEVLRHVANPVPSVEDCSDQSEVTQRSAAIDSLRRLQGLPSWCPDWTQDIPPRTLKNMQGYRQRMHGQFAAGISHAADLVFHSDHRLGLTGIKCDRVMHTGRWDQWWSYTDDGLKTLRQCCHMVANSLAHHTAQCNGCRTRVYGVRFKCQSCEDFELCSRCMRKPPVSHAREHKFSQIYFKSSAVQRNAEGWGDFIKEAQQWNTELRKVPNVQPQRRGDITYWFPDPSWASLSYVDYPFTEGDSLQDAFRRTLVGDQEIKRFDGARAGEALSALEELAAFSDVWYKMIEGCPFVTRAGKSGIFSQDVFSEALTRVSIQERALIVARMEYILGTKRMMVSQKGYIGVAPADTRIGDHICVLHGGEMPFILREWCADSNSTPAEGTAEDYILIGEAYVHGLMHGEAIAAADAGELQRVHMVLH